MQRRQHQDEKVKSLSIGGTRYDRGPDGAFEIADEHCAIADKMGLRKATVVKSQPAVDVKPVAAPVVTPAPVLTPEPVKPFENRKRRR